MISSAAPSSDLRLSKIAEQTINLAPLCSETAENLIGELRATKTTAQIRKVLRNVALIIEKHAVNEAVYVAFGVAFERTRPSFGLRPFWQDLWMLFPTNSTAIRLTMRWYRRDRILQTGIDLMEHWLPEARSNVSQAKLAVAGLAELNATDVIADVATSCLKVHSHRDDLRMIYIRLLAKQARFLAAQEEVTKLHDADDVSSKDAEFIEFVAERAQRHTEFCESADTDIVAKAIEVIAARVKPDPRDAVVGRVSFFTGTLGQGGAERQMSRIATALHQSLSETLKNNCGFDSFYSDVVVRSARVDNEDGFFLPSLLSAGIPVLSLVDQATPEQSAVASGDEVIGKILNLVPDTILDTTLKLARHYHDTKPEVAYLWQDGAVLDGCLAALIAGVPTIATSFRGLPPGVRPELDRPHMKEAFRALARLPNVVFTANSQIVATAYENWLQLEKNSIEVILNAAPVLTKTGSNTDHELWQDIVSQSQACDQTVLGIFRHDQNKRPQLWIEIASIASRLLPRTRFVILGDGSDFEDSHRLVEEKGLKHRVFMPGVRRNVGFYLSRSDMLMHVSLMEGLPNALLEAHTAGLPVLTTPAGGAAEIVKHGETGFVLPTVDAVSPADVAEKLNEMLSNRDLLKQMGKLAKERIAEPFEINLVLCRTLAVFAGTKHT